MSEINSISTFEGLGTHWKLQVFDKTLRERRKIEQSIVKVVSEFEKDYSRFDANSWTGRLNSTLEIINPPQELFDMISYALECAEISENHFNIAAGGRLEDIGYDQTYSLRKKRTLRKIVPLADAVTLGKGSIRLKEGSSLDLGGFGKGWLIDKIAVKLNELGVPHYIVDGGGDIYARGNGQNNRSIPLEDPFQEKKIIGNIKLGNGSVASSSPKHRTWPDIKTGKSLHHLVNPKSEATIEDVAAVFTHAKTATNADTASTCLFVSPRTLHSQIKEHFSVSYCIVYSDRSFYTTEDYPGNIFTKS